jgi:chromate transporter
VPESRGEHAAGGGTALQVLLASLRLGCISFGGPIAHLGYFEREYVARRAWLGSEDYASIVALCQVLPGPTSSQVGFLIGWHRAGWQGALAAWLGFTLPAACLMAAFGWFAPQWHGALMEATLHGLLLAAVAVVAQAVLSMARRLCPDWRRAVIAILVGVALLVAGNGVMQVAALGASALAGALLCRPRQANEAVAGAGTDADADGHRSSIVPIKTSIAGWACVIFLVLLVGMPLLAQLAPHGLFALADIFYRCGALVFGGGHVVLPLLRDALVPSAWMSDASFLAGYGAAQALPGPLFSVAAYLGVVAAPAPVLAPVWSAVALFAIFAPGLLLAVGGFWLWRWCAGVPGATAALAGVNAGVVGVLGAAFYNPVWTTAIHSLADIVIASGGFLLLQRWRAAPLVVVIACLCATVVTQILV